MYNDPHFRQYALTCGSTAVVALVTPTKIICAHVGDARAMVCGVSGNGPDRVTVVQSLTTDHKPTDESETERIGAALPSNRGYKVSTDESGLKSVNPLYMKYSKDHLGQFSG